MNQHYQTVSDIFRDYTAGRISRRRALQLVAAIGIAGLAGGSIGRAQAHDDANANRGTGARSTG